MSSVVDFAAAKEARQPHSSGEARCMDCGHQWVSVAPAGTVWLQCPQCTLVRGRFVYAHQIEDGEHWTCSCGNDLFHITRSGVYCPNCGDSQEGF